MKTELLAMALEELDHPTYRRKNVALATSALDALHVEKPEVKAFYENHEGPFWSERLGYELLDICEGEVTVATATADCREFHHFPDSLICLTELSAAGQVLVAELPDFAIHEIDFEGTHLELLEGKLQARWTNFTNLLNDFFRPRESKNKQGSISMKN